jgi:hypothetical protein
MTVPPKPQTVSFAVQANPTVAESPTVADEQFSLIPLTHSEREPDPLMGLLQASL